MTYPTRLRIHVWRWLPFLLLAIALYRLGLQPGSDLRDPFPMQFCALLPVLFGPVWGPLRRRVSGDPFDAVEKRVERQSLATGAAAVAIFAICGSTILGLGDLLGWAPSTADDWMAIGFFLLALFYNIYLLRAAWTVPMETHCRS